MRRTSLQRKTPLKRTAFNPSPPEKRKPRKKNRIPPDIRHSVMQRADLQCEVMADPLCTGRAEEWHHRKLRSQGGEHTIENGLGICQACHRMIHRNTGQSYERGWLVKSTYDPADVPVTRRGLVVLLDQQGGFLMKEKE